MTAITSSRPVARSSIIAQAVRYLFDARRRRLLADMRQRELWVYEAQTAPTVQEWTESLET